MHEIVPGSLWIGHAGDARDARRLVDAGIAAVVDLALEESPPRLPREMTYCRFPLVDGAGNPPWTLRAAVETTESLIRRGVPTLVCCGAGMSRSPAVAAAALSAIRGAPPETVLEEIVAGRPHDMTSGLWADVQAALRA
ncbi:MAG: dual specificity protein phosphatase [Planctomycetales bacterium]